MLPAVVGVNNTVMSPRFKLDKEDLRKIVKVFLWTTGSALVAALISVVGSLQVDTKDLLLVSAVNVVLFAIQKFLADNKPKQSA